MWLCFWCQIIALDFALSQSVTFYTLPENATVIEGGSARFECNVSLPNYRWYLTPPQATGLPPVPIGANRTDIAGLSGAYVLGGTLILDGVQSLLQSSTIACAVDTGPPDFNVVTQDPPFAYLILAFPPNITSNTTADIALEGDQFTLRYTIKNTESLNFEVTKDGVNVLLTGDRLCVDLTSMTINNVNRTDRGNYIITVTTLAGNDSISFYLDVYYVAEFPKVKRMEEIGQGNTFTLNCTPSAANPPPSSYMFERDGVDITEGVSGSILTVSSLERREDSGNYTCMVTNEAGSVTISIYLNVLAPPTVPRQLMSVDYSPFSVTLIWEVPSDDGGTSQPLSYTVRVINDTASLSFSTTSIQLIVTMDDGIWHSSVYSVIVYSENEYGVSPSAASTFTTPDSVPIIESVSVEALSLTILSVNVAILTDGGQRVDNYTIVLTTSNNYFNGNTTITIILDSAKGPFSIPILEGRQHVVMVIATSQIGESMAFTVPYISELPSTKPISKSSDVVGVAVGGALGGFLLGIIVTTVSVVGIYICYIRCYHRNSIKYTINKKAKEVVYEEFPLEDVKIESNPSYGVPSARTTSIANPQVVEEKGQNTEVKTEADYI